MEDENIRYCKDMLRKTDYARYLQCSFYPAAIPYYALDAELKHIHQHVSEEMIGHIRYAWWQESIDAIKVGAPRQHPVLMALSKSNIDNDLLVKLVESYREAWPNLPEHPPELPVDDAKWNKAGSIIKAHGFKPRWLLVLKLLFLS